MLKRKNDFDDRYNKFIHELKDEIISGRIKPGEFILPENTLSKEYDLSRVSIRKALAQLVEEGLIEKIPGKGNRVSIPEDTQKQTITLGWFSNSYEIEIVEQIIERFEQLNPYIKVNLQILPNSMYVYHLTEAIKTNSGPDVFIVSDYHFRELAESKRLDIVDPFLPEHINPEKDSYDKVFEMFTHEGKLHVTPFVFSPVMICYNKSMFQKAGIPEKVKMGSWDDLLDMARRNTKDFDGNQLIDQYGFCFSSLTNRWPVFLLQNNGRFMTEDRTRSMMNSKENIEALDFCVDLMYKHQVSPIFSHGSNVLAENLFMRERAAMILTTYYFMNEFRDHKIKWDVLPPPKKTAPATLLLGGALGINSESQVKEAAQALISYMVSTEAQTMVKQNGCTIPVLRFVAEDNYLLKPGVHPANYNAFKDIMPNAVCVKDLNVTIKELELIESELHLLWANMEKAEDSCKRIDDLLNEGVTVS
ncbi:MULTISPECIES: extracellular solute-binding protein [unclassified Mesobacillus]|jgi:multiple sugar transport system substrate-binding protein|uniref:extracellular solute-binding protein n=1 Tax=unclassified Mesobacillus TaxID=2675270 RepID=UPI002040D647|nr:MULTISPECIES: extracellular solute-binding protein [unclassified Mesobacillus]MCM3123842.1 extracellular solute-binding protein [Mesobacillus sp. MER 33]MCM3234143.1 extracellular solute-binding protein [Mesobacillus sp. MER 48]